MQLRVALAMRKASGYNDMVVRGIGAYARPDRPWIFDRDMPTREGIARLLALKPDGLLINSVDDSATSLLDRSSVPVVNVGRSVMSQRVRQVGNDAEAIGAMAAAHFVTRGYRQFGYYGRTGTPLDTRLDAFERAVAKSGYQCHVFDARASQAIFPSLRQENEELSEWLESLPKPIGIFCVFDDPAWVVAEHCRRLNIVVPRSVAILGVDNDVSVCALAAPQLSSIQTSGERIGYEACELLDALMQGKSPNERLILVPPVRVVCRRSTDAVAASDVLVARALAYMKTHLVDRDGVDALCGALGCARRTLEARFRTSIGIAPARAWSRFRFEEAQRLLADTDLGIELVTERSGFSESRQLQVAFRQTLGLTPSEFRRQATPTRTSGT